MDRYTFRLSRHRVPIVLGLIILAVIVQMSWHENSRSAVKYRSKRAEQQKTHQTVPLEDPWNTDLEVLSPINGSDVDSVNTTMPRGLRLAFIGDSLSWYQYLSLAHFLRYGMFPPTKFVRDKFYSGWMNFYNRTNSVLSPMEQCDCYRSGDKVQIKGSKIGSTTLENRYFYDSEHDNLVIISRNLAFFHSKHFTTHRTLTLRPRNCTQNTQERLS